MKNKVREEIAQAFIDSLKENVIPWNKEWVGGERAFNPISGTKYKGVNAFWLAYVAQLEQYKDPRWCTFKQATEKGWKVKAGSKGTRIEFFSPYDREEKKKITWNKVKELENQLSPEEFKLRVSYLSSAYTVFNAMQIEGIPEYEVKRAKWDKDKVINVRNTLFKNMELTFHEGGDQAFYRPSDDSITLPVIENFKSEYGYMATMLHESAHATGAEKRLNRNMKNIFGSEEYAREELRAEIASAFTAQELGLSNANMEHTNNHKAYIQNWISVLQNDSSELFRAIKDAEQISDYLIEKGEFHNKLEDITNKEKMEKIQDNVEVCKSLVNNIVKGTIVEDNVIENDNRFSMYNEKKFIQSTNKIAIYQVKDSDEYADYLFSSFEEIKKAGLDVDRANYDLTYVCDYNPEMSLDDIYEEFNINRPFDFKGHSLSISDIIVINDGINITAHYVDTIGFKNISDIINVKDNKIQFNKEDRVTILANKLLSFTKEYDFYQYRDNYNSDVEFINEMILTLSSQAGVKGLQNEINDIQEELEDEGLIRRTQILLNDLDRIENDEILGSSLENLAAQKRKKESEQISEKTTQEEKREEDIPKNNVILGF